MMSETTFSVSPQHPAFPGHFPAAPIVPGAVLLDEILRAIEVAHNSPLVQCTISWAKFRSSVGPGESLTLRHEQRPDGSISFVIRTPFRMIADGIITLSPAEALDVP